MLGNFKKNTHTFIYLLVFLFFQICSLPPAGRPGRGCQVPHGVSWIGRSDVAPFADVGFCDCRLSAFGNGLHLCIAGVI